MSAAFASPPVDRVAAAKRGDRRAFEALYRQHVGAVYAVCLRIAGDVPTAEEIVQETFVRAWRKLDSFRADASFGAWLRRLAINTALNDRRSHTRRLARVVPTGDPIRLEVQRTPGAVMDLERAVASLPPKARHVFILKAIEGWTHAEIARQLGVSEGTSKTQHQRARQLLQEALS